MSTKLLPNLPGGALGEVVADVAQHLTQRHQTAAALFLEDLRRYHGYSAGLVTNIAEKIDAGRSERLRPPGGEPADYDKRLKQLRPHERRLLTQLTLRPVGRVAGPTQL
jgi:hypothetical protein